MVDTATPQPESTVAQLEPEDPPPVAKTRSRAKRGSKKLAAGADHYVPPFVNFQQTILREKLKVISDEEAAAVERHIEDAYANAMRIWEQPWLGLMKPGKSEDKLENEYYEK